MNGLERNIAKLMSNEQKLFLAAFDHPHLYGVVEGLEDPIKAIDRTLASEIDGYLLNAGVFSLLDAQRVKDKKLILRSTVGGTVMYGPMTDRHTVTVSPEQALSLGADAVILMLILGGSRDLETMTDIARAIDAFHRYSIPVIVEVMHADLSRNNDTPFVRDGARIAAELGSDIVKSFYCDDFESVVKSCPVPILLAGGPKEANIIDVATEVVSYGAAGFAFGRNIFQHPDPPAIISSLNKVLRP